MAKGEAEVYKPAEACRIAEVAPYVLRYWETEFPALSEGREKGPARLYTARDVKIIARIRELLYDEGFTVAGAKKRLDAEIAEGRFDDGRAAPPSRGDQRRAELQDRMAPPAPRKAEPVTPRAESQPPLLSVAPLLKEPGTAKGAARESAPSSDFDRRSVLQELKEIVKLLDRGRSR